MPNTANTDAQAAQNKRFTEVQRTYRTIRSVYECVSVWHPQTK